MEESSSNKTESTKDSSTHLKQAVQMFSETTNQIIDSVSWLAGKMYSNGSAYKLESAKGQNAEVSLSIPPGGTGEILVILGQSRKHFPARAVDPEAEFKRGSKVFIADVAVSTMYVSSIPEADA